MIALVAVGQLVAWAVITVLALVFVVWMARRAGGR